MNSRSSSLRLKTLDDHWTEISAGQLEVLASSMRGDLIARGDANYDQAREIWNSRRINRYPMLIARCAGVADVKHVVDFARRRNLLTSIKGGGHNAAGFALVDDGLVMDMSTMNAIWVDPRKKLAITQAGAAWRGLDRETQVFGLAVTGAIVSMTGIAGFTLGGGLGWLHRKCGSASDNLLSVDLVTADGEAITASSEEHPDLFWALKGGGGNFGVVTSFTFSLRDVGPDVLAGLIFYPIDEAWPVIKCFLALMEHAPADLGAWVMMRKAPPLPTLPENLWGKPVVTIGVCYTGSNLDDGDELLRPLIASCEPAAYLVKRRRYVEWQSALDAAWGNGFQNDWKGHYLRDLPEEVFHVLKEYVEAASPYTDIKLPYLGGRFAQMGENDSAMGARDSRLAMVIQTRWLDDEASAHQLRWAADLHKAVQPFATGRVYANFVGNEGAERIRAIYSETVLQRLIRVKQNYDPDNFFRMNQNLVH
jgi:FAD/FMN-containing dehydrogenase